MKAHSLIFLFQPDKKRSMDSTPLHLILADDDESDRLIFKEAFEELKMKTIVHTVNDGVELMKYLSGTENALPHLLFLDLNMPRKNGLECLREIRSNEKLKDISIAIYSTSASEKDIEETFQSGANAYIKKPSSFSILKKMLEKAVLGAHQYQQQHFDKEHFMLQL
jgi:CheY-like chemotaxis protein